MKKVIGLAAAVAMVLSFAMTAAASEWNFYGNARVGTFVTDVDNVGGAADEDTFSEYLQGNSRIGAKVKVSDELSGRFEYGTGVNVRHLYGEWNFGAGKFLVGQSYTPLYMGYSSQVYDSDLGLEDFGACSVSRRPMLQLKFGGFKIAAVQPASDDLSTGGTIEHDLPKIEASYNFDFNNVAFELAAGYNAYEIIDGTNAHDIDSWVIGFGAEAKFGAFFLAGNVYAGENLGPYGLKTASDADPTIDANGHVKDSDGFGYILVAGYKFNDMFKMEAGYGYEESERDGAVSEDDSQAYYIQGKVTMAPGVYMTPEIGVTDLGHDGSNNEESETLYYGIKWQISF